MTVDRLRTAQAGTLDASTLRRVFENLSVESCPHTYNFHMHTVCSDGKLQPAELMTQAIAIGLKGMAITDHHTIEGYRAAQRWLEDWQWNHPGQPVPHLWTGTEINASLLNTEVHILAYAFDPHHGAIQRYLGRRTLSGNDYQADRVIAAIHQAGGLAVLAHPARYRKSHHDLIPAAAKAGIDGVEAFYAYSNPTPWKPSPQQTHEVRSLSANYHLLNTCGTDTHGRSLLQRL
ncbi:PHP domain-containing protein [Microcoleus sp. FACHB-1515]|uniref:PHP domain-containing protein n=1 Tax=Cyanophyceae TaxID=3028117 RepID=UPI00168688AA|nr:PHP domain-containing protein [Microcoleus sp. FACHB-1515]MBD2091715.1 PHP domain-containing protein [Microcoleus sp. FACHB-1515]